MHGKNILLAGIIGPVIFVLVVIAAGAMYPGYDHFARVISDLGAANSPVKDFMNVFGFMLFGLFIAAFAAGVYRSRKSTLGKIIALLFLLGGIGMFLIGLFPSDGVHGVASETAKMHNLATYGTFAALFPAFVLLVVDTRGEKSMRYYFIVAGILGAITAYFAFMWFTFGGPGPVGFVQRIALGAPFLLMAYTAVKLRGLKSKP